MPGESAFTLPPLAPPPDLAALLPAGTPADLAVAAATVWTQAPFLKALIRRRRATLATLAAGGPEAAFAAAMAGVRGEAEALRTARADVALIVALADLAGRWPLETVTARLSDFADATIDAAIAAALAERDAPNIGLTALALGKLGSRELNYSSDSDLILLFEPDLMPRRAGEEPGEAAVRIARRAVALLADQTPDGYVMRVDLRLRPASEVTPMALSFGAAEHYYQSEALTWERVAFVRARACAGDVAAGEAFLARIRPFVWRRSLDWTAVRDIQSVSLRIRDHFEGGQAIGPGYDLKRGRGGIREVEFFAQIHQLIWGGRDPVLRAPATLDALTLLEASGRIETGEAARLATAYRFLRTLEHRLQMRRDEQTHMIPKLAADRQAVAALCGEANWAAVERRLKAVTAPVAAAYDKLIAAAQPAGDRIPAGPLAWLKARHGKHAKLLAGFVTRLRAAPLRALRAEAARDAFEAVLPALVAEIAAAADPPHAAARLETFLAALPSGAQFFALLQANPRLVGLLGHLLGVTPVLADALAARPALFDVLLGPDAFAAPLPARATVAMMMAEVGMDGVPDFSRRHPHPDPPHSPMAAPSGEEGGGSGSLPPESGAAGPRVGRAGVGAVGQSGLEDTLDIVRRVTAERRFQLGAQLVEGRIDPLVAAEALSDLADAALAVIVPAVAEDYARVHGRIAGGEPLVLALGRYGGRALTHASDLDLVYLFTGDHEALSDGDKPQPASLYFNRLAARLTAALSAPTAAGALYEVDTRLRPWGAKGLLALGLDSFTRYQSEEAEAWEHMALCRARLVAGSAEARAGAEAAIAAILARPRAAEPLRRAVLSMRAEIAAAKRPQGPWDVKLASGGLVDLEFLVHFAQLRSATGFTPRLGDAIAALEAAGELPPGLGAAHDRLTRFLVLLRLAAPQGRPPASFPPAVEAMLARALGAANFPALADELALAKAAVRAAWSAVFGEERRGDGS